MPDELSRRLAEVIDALPLRPGIRVLEIGCGPGAAARAVPFDIAFAIRVGALDGRHPELERQAHERIASALVPGGKLFIDAGYPLREVSLQAGGTPTRSNL